jgi:hypothetical protein
MRAEDKRVVAAEPSLAGSGVIGCFTRASIGRRGSCFTPLRRPRRLRLLFAVLGTDLGTKQGETGANKRDAVKRAGRAERYRAAGLRPSVSGETATGWLITQRSQVRILSPLPAKMAPGDSPGAISCSLGKLASLSDIIPSCLRWSGVVEGPTSTAVSMNLRLSEAGTRFATL